MEVRPLDHVVVRFAGDSGDGMQLMGNRFTAETAAFGNDLVTLPDYPAEIRAPAGTVPGVSSFQIHFAAREVTTPGDQPDALVALNPAALKANLSSLKPGGLIIVDSAEFTPRNLTKAGFTTDPLTDGTLARWQIVAADLTAQAIAAAEPFGLNRKAAARTKNMVALGLVCWLYGRPTSSTEAFLTLKFRNQTEVRDANLAAFRAGHAYGETAELFTVRYEVAPARKLPGTYRHISGNIATAYGLMAGAHLADLPLFLGSYPITPASEILHELAKRKDHGVTAFQAEDEIAGVASALGASFAGQLGVTTTSGPGLALKTETINLAVITELPLVIVDVQRGGPSTGLPTKTEQSDLLMALYGRPGESPLPVLAAQSPCDCFRTAVEACRIAVTYRTPVIMLTDGYLANGAEPWRVPELAELEPIEPNFATEPNGGSLDAKPVALETPGAKPRHWPYARDPETLIRDWAIPGTPGLEHRLGGLEKSVQGTISYDPRNHNDMVRLRQAKIEGIQRDIPDLAVDDPSGSARLLILGWGSTYGAIAAACDITRRCGYDIARAHLKHLNPFPANLEEVLDGYDQVVVAELNLGQLGAVLQARFQVPIMTYERVYGQPFNVTSLAESLIAIVQGPPVHPPYHVGSAKTITQSKSTPRRLAQ